MILAAVQRRVQLVVLAKAGVQRQAMREGQVMQHQEKPVAPAVDCAVESTEEAPGLCQRKEPLACILRQFLGLANSLSTPSSFLSA